MIACQLLAATILNDFSILGNYFWHYPTMFQYRNTSKMADKILGQIIYIFFISYCDLYNHAILNNL